MTSATGAGTHQTGLEFNTSARRVLLLSAHTHVSSASTLFGARLIPRETLELMTLREKGNQINEMSMLVGQVISKCCLLG